MRHPPRTFVPKNTETQTAVDELPTEHLDAELVAHAAWETAAMARMLRILGEWDRRAARSIDLFRTSSGWCPT